MAKKMNHSEYIARTRKMTESALRFTIDDCKQAIAAMPENENAGYYADEIHYCGMELTRRQKKNR